MKTLNYSPICDASGNFLGWLNALRNLSGAYVIREKSTKQTLYIGDSATGNLAKTIKRHFTRGATTPNGSTTFMTGTRLK